MLKRTLAALAVALFVAPLTFGSASAQDAKTKKDLQSVILLQGLPCGSVKSYEKKGENDYIATCENGKRYHVFVDQGRVQVVAQ
ncbi:hypothetical protein [Oceanibacterium hippocampi]|uniref:PepSY domain-containing protein n=1 Tax=Oceanibacterium hippocampi TaxID=745714 RepID=A0A1Y5TZB7_9PROT|nr:hypothetical protein [Oceanibacterium hippocampi]SLN74896.1 hypothetical protein OCH7691_03820 [Oceanibacterium hippocampi]